MVRWPQVLCLHLKRWRRLRDGRRFEKSDTQVAFKEREHVEASDHVYRLRSVCNHAGMAGGGHYTSFVRGHGGGWYFCDDGVSPSQTEVARVLGSEGYMLFYEREQ